MRSGHCSYVLGNSIYFSLQHFETRQPENSKQNAFRWSKVGSLSLPTTVGISIRFQVYLGLYGSNAIEVKHKCYKKEGKGKK